MLVLWSSLWGPWSRTSPLRRQTWSPRPLLSSHRRSEYNVCASANWMTPKTQCYHLSVAEFVHSSHMWICTFLLINSRLLVLFWLFLTVHHQLQDFPSLGCNGSQVYFGTTWKLTCRRLEICSKQAIHHCKHFVSFLCNTACTWQCNSKKGLLCKLIDFPTA